MQAVKRNSDLLPWIAGEATTWPHNYGATYLGGSGLPSGVSMCRVGAVDCGNDARETSLQSAEAVCSLGKEIDPNFRQKVFDSVAVLRIRTLQKQTNVSLVIDADFPEAGEVN